MILYRCNTPDCDFLISRRKLADILMNENHILLTCLSEQQRIPLAEAINSPSLIVTECVGFYRKSHNTQRNCLS